jgi:hypothetical protein
MKKRTLIIIVLLAAIIVDLAAQTEGENPITLNFNLYSTLGGSGAYDFNRNKFNGGFDIWANARVDGNLGSAVTYFADIGVALISAERRNLGSWPVSVSSDLSLTIPSTVVYSQPLAYFPYTYRSPWAGFLFPLSNLGNSHTGWPDTTSIGFNLLCNVSGSAFDGNFLWSIGRIGHEAAGIVEGSSLVMNKAAQPFFGFDIQVNFFPWLSLYSLSGILEYYSSQGIKASALSFQNGFTLTMLTAKIGQYVQIDAGSSAVWPKRFELGYLFPLMLPLLYQNNIGDFDNATVFGNIKLQYPGLGFLWFSLFVDEMSFEENFFNLDREMYSFQAGMQFTLPFFSSSSITLSYTKIEPYCYTHPSTTVPWYDRPMEEAYVNYGKGLGYYLPPNSDEIKLVFAAELSQQVAFDAQFQMIRHGADYGSSMVDGSSYVSEMIYSGIGNDSVLRKYFLHDGAYQWFYIIKAGASWNLPTRMPISIFGDMGMVISYFTNISGSANSGTSSGYSIIDTTEYPKSTSLILTIGCRVSIF